MIPQPVLLLQQGEGRLDERRHHVQEAVHAAGVDGVLVDQNAAEVEKARVLVGGVQPDHLGEYVGQDLLQLLTDAAQQEPQAARAPFHYPQVGLVLFQRVRYHRPHLRNTIIKGL